MAEVLLYDHGPSPFARIVRLLLAEKNLGYKKRDVNYLAKLEHLSPWYAHVNPKMQVPSMTVTEEGKDKVTLTDSHDILVYMEKDFEGGTALVDPRKQRDTWAFVDAFYDIKPMALFYQNFRDKSPAVLDMMTDMHQKMVQVVEGNAEKFPELKDVYLKKKEDMLAYRAAYIESSDEFAPNKKKVDDLVDRAEELLKDSETGFLFGDYSVADVTLTCMLAMLISFGFCSLEDKPNVSKFYQAAKNRPSWKAADIQDTIPLKMKIMMAVGSFIYKIKAAIMPKVNEGMKEADKIVSEIKETATESLDKAIGVSQSK